MPFLIATDHAGADVTEDATLETSVVEIIDGDSFTISTETEPIVVHLFGIDAPELEQKWGAAAREYLEGLAFGKTVTMQQEIKPDGEITTSVLVAGQDLSQAVAEAGFAWISSTTKTNDRLAAAVMSARFARKGMWVDDYSTLVHPSLWREQERLAPASATPTPTPEPLSAYANQKTLQKGSEPSVEINNIPSKKALENAKGTFRAAMQSLGHKHESVQRRQQEFESRCGAVLDLKPVDGNQVIVWSEEKETWVLIRPYRVPTGCVSDAERVIERWREITIKKRNAISQAKWFGISESYINRWVLANDLQDY